MPTRRRAGVASIRRGRGRKCRRRGRLPNSGWRRARLPGATADKEYAEPEPDTSYVCVIDRHGNAFSATPSDGALNTPVIPGTGIAPSSRGMQSWTDPAHPACLAPGKRPRLTPSPAIARREGKWTMPFGTPGNDVQPQAMLQVFLNMAVFEMTPQQAIEQPRFASVELPRDRPIRTPIRRGG